MAISIRIQRMRHLLFFLCLFISLVFINLALADIVLDSKLQEVKKYSQVPVADRCRTVSQEKKMGAVFDQGSLGWCYGYVAADLYSFELNLPAKSRVSPLWMSATHQLTDRDEIKEAYFNNVVNRQDIASLLIEYDIKHRNNEKDEEGKYKNSYQLTSAEVLSQRQNSMASKKKTKLSESAGGLIRNALEISMSLNRVCTINDLKNFENLKPSTAAWVIEKSAKGINCGHKSNLENNIIDFVEIQKAAVKAQKDFINSRCSLPNPKYNRNKVVDLNYTVDNPMPKEKRQQALYDMNESLDKNSIFGISYRARLITQDDPGQHDYHAGTVIGRKLIDNKCFYQIRNSWGPGCDQYKDNNPNVKCEHGGSIYVEEDELIDHLNGITKFVDPKN